MSRRSRRGESGSATVLVLVAALLLSVCAVAGAVLEGLAGAQRRVESAADLAALAGAAAVQGGRDGCAAAGVVARRNRAEVVGCRTRGEAVEVRVVRRLELPVLDTVKLRSQARAGPSGAGAVR